MLLYVFHTTLPNNTYFYFLDSDLKVLQTSPIFKKEYFHSLNLISISLAQCSLELFFITRQNMSPQKSR